MGTIDEVHSWRGRDAVDPSGDKVGKIDEIYLDRRSGDPEWAAIKTGLLGTKLSFAPLDGAAAAGDEVRLAHDKATIQDAPNVGADGELSPKEERRLWDHYGRGDYDEEEDRFDRDRDREDRGDRDDVRGFTGDSRETERPRLRRFVVPDTVETTSPSQRDAGRDRF